MSQGDGRTDKIMAPLAFRGLPAEIYNRIYESVDLLPADNAERLVKAVRAALLAERERCARVVEGLVLPAGERAGNLIVIPTATIAAAIREEPTDD